MEQQAACGAAGIDRLVEDDQVHLLGGDLSRDLGQVEDRASQAIKSRDDELVALAYERQRLTECLALVAARTALLLLEDLLAAMGVELVELGFKILPDRRDASVSDFHEG